MTNEEVIAAFQKGRSKDRIFNLASLAVVLFFVWTMDDRHRGSVENTVAPRINNETITNVGKSEIDYALEEAIARGYYTKREFALKNGVTERTVDNWRSSGMAASKDEKGQVMIPLDAKRP